MTGTLMSSRILERTEWNFLMFLCQGIQLTHVDIRCQVNLKGRLQSVLEHMTLNIEVRHFLGVYSFHGRLKF